MERIFKKITDVSIVFENTSKTYYKQKPAFRLNNKKDIEREEYNYMKTNEFVFIRKGDILIEKNPYNIKMIEKDMDENNLDGKYIVVRPGENCIREYIMAAIDTLIVDKIEDCKEMGDKNIIVKYEEIKNMEIPLPSTEEQKNFADLWEESRKKERIYMELAENQRKYFISVFTELLMEKEESTND